MVTGNVQIPSDAAAAITELIEVRAGCGDSFAARTGNRVGLRAVRQAGKVVKREHIADLDADLVQFENGVRLNLKKTDFEVGRIRLSTRVGNGLDHRTCVVSAGLAALAAGPLTQAGWANTVRTIAPDSRWKNGRRGLFHWHGRVRF